MESLQRRNKILLAQNRALEKVLEGETLYQVTHDLLLEIDETLGTRSLLGLADENSKSIIVAAAPSFTDDFINPYSTYPIAADSGPCLASIYFNKDYHAPEISNTDLRGEFKDLAIRENLQSVWSTPLRSPLGNLIGSYSFFLSNSLLSIQEIKDSFSIVSQTLSLLVSKEHERCLSLCERVNSTEEEFRLLAETAPQMPFIADQNGNIIYYNQKFYDYVGRGADVCGWRWTQNAIHHPDDIELAIELWKKSMASGVPYQVEYRMRRHDGQYRWFLGRALPVRDQSGKVFRWYGTNIDIHEQKMLANRLSMAVRTADLAFWELDLKSGSMTWSHKFCELFQLEKSKVSGQVRELLRFIHPEDVALVKQNLTRKRHYGERFSMEFRLILNGEVRWMEVHSEYLQDKSDPSSYIHGAMLDITSKKRANIALKKAKEMAFNASEAKSRFLANMSHEIRTPIGVILGYTELLQMGQPSAEECKEYYEIILGSCKGLTRIVDDILDLSKVEAGRLELESKRFDLNKCFDDVYEFFKDLARTKGIDFKLQRPEDIPPYLYSDVTRIKQVLINLVGNAIKFTEAGSVHIEVETTGLTQDNLCVSAMITDTGLGICPRQLKKLFRPFTQADSSTSKKYGGTGLGLVLSKRLAKALGGDVEVVYSKPNKGSAFKFWFTAPRSDRDEELLNDDFDHSCDLKDVRILIADDFERNQFLIKKILTSRGASVDLVSNGLEAISQAGKKIYDILLMDIQMPELDGREATRILRESGYKKPIVALTAHAMLEEKRMNMEAGCDDYLTKPIDIRKLIKTIKHHSLIC